MTKGKEELSANDTLRNEAVSNSLAAALRSLDPVEKDNSMRYFYTDYGHVQLASESKAAEAKRQIDRIKPFLIWADEDAEASVDKTSLNQTIGLINLLTTTPSPIPMLSIDAEGFASFYLSCEGNSIEAIIGNNKVEYLYSLGNEDQFHEEDIEIGRIPPKLLYFLYSQFAKNKVKSEAK